MSCRACGAVAYAVVDGAERCRACIAIDAVRAEGFVAGVAAERERCNAWMRLCELGRVEWWEAKDRIESGEPALMESGE